ncbi:hypothetical protein MC45_11615 [Sphingomonas taxi]|uniref:Uncharacterized protein n=1 Tax=Sphingomonas taxi TaxID=1549858 RepID=A0A097EH67_9SPHN|nr:hypothetical protein [Sphingomonas taxi]AIT06915.1 hypothetical protein MC45_11615 [Sphingomonas taxi]
MIPVFRPTLLAAVAFVASPAAAAFPGQSAPIPAVSRDAGSGISYADLTDLVIASPVIADATIRSAVRLKGADAVGVAPGFTRFYVEADLGALVRGAGGLPPRIGYLLDIAPDSSGRLPKLKKMRVLLFGRPVAGRPDQIQLAAPDAQIVWSSADDARVRAIATALVAADAPPVITGIGNVFHVPGALPGEGETQVFLTTANGAPVSLTVLRRPGEQPRWAVALSEIVDEAAAPPARDTLLWYRLACALPADLPEQSIASLAASDATLAREDYGYVREQLGACRRTRTIRP